MTGNGRDGRGHGMGREGREKRKGREKEERCYNPKLQFLAPPLLIWTRFRKTWIRPCMSCMLTRDKYYNTRTILFVDCHCIILFYFILFYNRSNFLGVIQTDRPLIKTFV